MATTADHTGANAVTSDSRDVSLTPAELIRPCLPGSLGFRTTDELPDSAITLGQQRAVSAIQFGVDMRHAGYNLFALGPSNAGEHTIVRQFLEARAAHDPTARDWCYVHNFEQPHRPRAISLPAGRGITLRNDMNQLVEDLRMAVSAALETDEYRQRHQQLDQEYDNRKQAALTELGRRAAERSVALIQTPVGFTLAPMREGDPLDAEEFAKLPEADRARLQAAVAEFERELDRLLHEIPKWRREGREKERALKSAVTSRAVDALIDELSKAYEGHHDVQHYLSLVKKDVVEHADDFRRGKEEDEGASLEALIAKTVMASRPLGRYQVNVLDDQTGVTGARVVYEDKPTFQNLIGRIEHVAQMGTLVTHFALIKPGALHRANGGYLIVDARRLLLEPFAWEGLKRALRAGALRIESLGEALSLVSTISLDPEPIPLNVKVVLIGERLLYYLLYEFDPDFRKLFKVAVDFEASTDRSDEADALYAAMIATLARRAGLRPFTAAGVARVIEYGARMVGDAGKLWLGLDALSDLLKEANHFADASAAAAVDVPDVERAIDARIYRSGRPRERLQEEIARGTIAIATDGEMVGQANGLSVIELGGFAFARPSRITARVRLGSGRVVDIEREVELGGPIHSKGVLILAGFVNGRYAPDQPLSLSASIVFEQSYGPVEGDSASSAELYALLSALADVPLKQSIAVTGAINQRGELQAVGAINEKIEGFFDICKAKGLTGDQGVLMPSANKRHLMLRRDVIEAVAARRFHIYAVDNIDDGVMVLTGMPAGTRDAAGSFPAGTFNERVESRLLALARQARAFKTAVEGPEAEPAARK